MRVTGKPLSGDGRSALLPAAVGTPLLPCVGVAQVFIPIWGSSGSSIRSYMAQIFIDIYSYI